MSTLRVCSCSFVALSLVLAAGCGPTPTAPDAAASTIPSSPAGRFALTSELELAIPPVAEPVLTTLTAATDGPDDPTRYLVDRMIATLPDGPAKTVATQAAPYAAAYLNARLGEIAPRFMPGIAALAAGLSRIATHVGTTETLEIDRDGDAIRTLTGVRFTVGGTSTAVAFADHGRADLAVSVRVAIDPAGRLAIAEHSHPLPYGAVLRLGLDRAVIPSVEPTAHDLAAALAALIDCDQLGALVADRLGIGAPALYRAACRAAMTATASEIDARIAAIDQAPLALELTGAAQAVDLDGDGAMDELRAGRWSGAVASASSRAPIGPASFTAAAAPGPHLGAGGPPGPRVGYGRSEPSP